MRSSVSIRALHYFAIFLTLVMNACAGSNLAPNTASAPQSRDMASSVAAITTRILPNTSGRFGLIQVLDKYARGGTAMTTAQIQSEAPFEDSVWGEFQFPYWRNAKANIFLSRYYMPFEDNSLVSTNTLTYFLAHHPDWILYGCQANGTPTSNYAWSGTGFQNDTPLDIHNPAVVAYQLSTLVAYLQAHSYNAVAIDNVTFVNFLTSPNRILQPNATSSPGAYGCGIYTQGPGVPSSFVRRYSTGFDKVDPAFTADLENWVHQAKVTLASHGFKVIVNHPLIDSAPNTNEQQLLTNIDGLLDENGFSHYGSKLSATPFANTLNWMVNLQSRGIAIFITNYFCFKGTDPNTGLACQPNPSTLTGPEVDWGLASYALGNNGGADVYNSPMGGAIYTYRPEYSRTYGAACGAFSKVGSAYVRRFTGGYAIVNPAGAATQTVNLPAHTYTDIEGTSPVPQTLSVPGGTAYMLLTTANTCS